MKVSEPCLFADMVVKRVEATPIEDYSNPRVRMWNCGGDTLSDAEVLSLVIGKCSGNVNPIEVAKSILSECNGKFGELARMQPHDLYRHLGVGTSVATKILAAIELAKRMQRETAIERKRIDSASAIYDILRPTMAYQTEEHARALLLNHNFGLIKDIEIGKGGLTETAIDIRVIAREALLANASVVAIAHNHPSGSLRPSRMDDDVTSRVKQGLSTLRIFLLDHVIVTQGGYYSYSEQGRL